MAEATTEPAAGRSSLMPALERMAADILRFALPVLFAFFVGAVVLAFIGENPLDTYALMLSEGFGSSRRLAATLSAATPLLFTAVATAICFRSGVFNVGVDGAFVLGGLAAAAAGTLLPVAFGWSIAPLAMVAAMAVAGVWLYVPGLLLARLDVDEVVSTLMLNFIALGLSGFLVNTLLLSETSGNNTTDTIHAVAELSRLMPPSTLHSGFLIGLACVFAYWVWARWTPAGYEAKLVGLNQRFARAVGIAIPASIVLVMAISGIVAGLGGASHALGQVHKFSDGFSAGYGFTGMAVALLARNSAFGIVFGAVLFGALASAGTTIQLFSDVPLDIVNVIEGTVMIFAVMELGRLSLRRGRAS
ncbi:MAG: ABC transporter permease [Nitratireductor sp.]